MGGIESARDREHDFLDARELEALGQPLDLNVEDLCAALVAALRIGRHVREALKAARAEQQSLFSRQLERHANGAKVGQTVPLELHVLAEGVLAHALRADALEVDLRGDELWLIAEPL